MNNKARLTVALMLFIGILALALNRAAWAGPSSDKSAASAPLAGNPAPAAAEAQKGTVKPPPSTVIITESGTYSVGGFCTVIIEFKVEDLKAVVYVERPLPRPLPDGVHKVAQGCRVTYYKSDVFMEQMTAEQGTATICFAAIPQKQTSLYFHNTYAAAPVWSPLTTTVGVGGACGDASRSGTYVATFTEP